MATVPTVSPTPLQDHYTEETRAALWRRMLEAAYSALAGAHGPEGFRRRDSGSYDVVTHLETYPPFAPGAHAPRFLPRFRRLCVVAPAYPSDRQHTALLEVPLAPRTLALEDLPAPLVSSRAYDVRWPEQLRDGYRACVAAYGAWCAASDAEWSRGRATGHYEIQRGATHPARRAWLALEAEYLPRFRAWEAATGVDAYPTQPATPAAEEQEGR